MTSFRSELPQDVVIEWIKAFGFKNFRDKRWLQFPLTNPVTAELYDTIVPYYYPSRLPPYDYTNCKKILRHLLKKSEFSLLSKEVRVGKERRHEYSIQSNLPESQDEPKETWPLGVESQKDEETTH